MQGYLKTARLSAGGFLAEGPLFLFDYALRLIRVVVLLSLWRLTFGSDSAKLAGLDFGIEAVLTYTLVSEVFANQLNVKTGIVFALWQGDLINRFLRPLGVVGQFVAESAGRWSVSFLLFSLPLFLIAPLLGVNPLPASSLALLAFLISLPIAIAVGVAIDCIFGGLTVALEQNVWVIEGLRNALSILLSGSLLPLAVYPWGLGEVFGYLPFAAMASAPLRVYTGTGDPLMLIGLQLFWAVALLLVAGWLWSANREKLVGYGG